jgi:beta-lactam-binding protein with PASTA domain
MWQFIRKIGIEIYCFLTAPLVLKNCLGIVGIMGALVLTSTFWMKCYTNHGDSIEVPELAGLSYRDAKKKASRSDLEVDITDSIYQVDKPAGLVISQDPKPGSKVKENRTIYLAVTKNNPDLLKLPTLRGNDDFERYSKTLARMGLKPRITATTPDTKLEPNTILEVSYKGENVTRRIDSGSGVQVNMGDFIDFTVSAGADGQVVTEVPELGCMTLDAAREAIQNTGKTITKVQHIGQINREDDAYILRYNINGSEIDVYVVQKRPATCPE